MRNDSIETWIRTSLDQDGPANTDELVSRFGWTADSRNKLDAILERMRAELLIGFIKHYRGQPPKRYGVPNDVITTMKCRLCGSWCATERSLRYCRREKMFNVVKFGGRIDSLPYCKTCVRSKRIVNLAEMVRNDIRESESRERVFRVSPGSGKSYLNRV